MRKIVKHPNSIVISEKLRYKDGNSLNNSKISKVLYNEQKGFCAYTEEYIGRADAKDIEHFNPTLKGGNEDGYYNWFLVKHQWNNASRQNGSNFSLS
jgi:CRISPR/Cas system Type II protein with McrA/HNH and RuvC-like nuclease domain